MNLFKIFDKIKGFILNPVQEFRKSKDEDPTVYFIVLFIFYGIMSGISAYLVDAQGIFSNIISTIMILEPSTPSSSPLVFLGSLFAIIFAGMIITVILGFWLHLWAYIAGARNGIWKTEKGFIYAATPYLLIGWIPYIGIIGIIWSIILGILGLQELQDISRGRAIFAYLVALFTIVLIFTAIVAWFAFTYIVPNVKM